MNKKRWLVIIVIVAAAVLLAILFDTVLANHHPAITSLEAPEMVIPSGSCQISCNASDRDGDELSYNWSASGGNISGTGASVNWTAPDSEGSYNVTVWVTDGRGVEVMKQVTITVRTNEPPTITSLVVDADWTTPSSSLQVTCTASDPDGDKLSYKWTATGGDISGTDAVVNWTAPEEVGIYYVTVAAIDGHGEEDTKSVILIVNLDTPPAIEKLCVTPEGHKYLRRSGTPGCDYDVWKIREYDIECTASGTGELVYNWSCTRGEIAGEGSTITWTAPNEISVEATITVIVSDNAGNSVGKNIVLYVASCTCGSWGLESGCK
jgi:hypothetical protein